MNIFYLHQREEFFSYTVVNNLALALCDLF